MIGYEYGNTRLRVRAGRLLDADGYRGLLSSATLDGMLGGLAGGPYGRAIESALGRYRGLRRLDEAVRIHLSRQLADVLAFYSGEIRDRLRFYESRWDVRNIRTILRTLNQPVHGEALGPFLVPAGNLDEAALGELANQKDVRAAVDLLAAWQLPSPTVIRRLRHAMPGFLQNGDIAVLEAALDGAFGDSIVDFVSDARSADSFVSLLHEDVDRLNLMGALRRHQAGREVTLADSFLAMAGGRVSEQVWAELVELDDRAEVAAKLDGLLPVTWRGPLAAWVEHGELWVLERELDDAATEAGIARLRLGDPLGIDVPLGFIIRKEAEARNLRLVGRAIVHDLAREDMFDRLVGVR